MSVFICECNTKGKSTEVMEIVMIKISSLSFKGWIMKKILSYPDKFILCRQRQLKIKIKTEPKKKNDVRLKSNLLTNCFIESWKPESKHYSYEDYMYRFLIAIKLSNNMYMYQHMIKKYHHIVTFTTVMKKDQRKMKTISIINGKIN